MYRVSFSSMQEIHSVSWGRNATIKEIEIGGNDDGHILYRVISDKQFCVVVIPGVFLYGAHTLDNC